MKKKSLKNYTIIAVITLFFGLAIMSTVNAQENINKNKIKTLSENNIYFNTFDDYTNLTVEEAWNLLNSTSNGIQKPIDVRTNQEWINWHIDTPYPEQPIQHILTDLQDPVKLQQFMELYEGKEIVMYCHSGYRSWLATQILIENNFNGVIYNIPGGITGWSAAGLPTVGNRNPEKPNINGPSTGKPETKYSFTIIANDPDYDTVFLCINWSDDTGEICIGPYESGEEISVSHTWTEKGTYSIKAKTQDKYGNESEISTLDISIPRNRFYNIFLIQRIFDRHPILNRIINKL